MIVDSHCHLHDPVFEDLRGTLARATENDVWGAVAVGCDRETNARTLELAGSYGKCVRPAMGFHPDWLQLTDEEDVLEAGIEIMASPPGKRVVNGNALSGGEKTLTAVALLVSVFQVRPSPFFLLDEVDAALDDANVGRFNEIVKELARGALEVSETPAGGSRC